MMNKLNIGLIGYGNVGAGVVKFILKRRAQIKEKFFVDLVLKIICDRRISEKNPKDLGKTLLTSNIDDVLNDPEVDVIIELIGGLHPAKELVLSALRKGKHVVTANKELIAHHGKELFQEVHASDRNIYFETSVMAGVPLIKTIAEGLAGNQFNGLYGIINGTCNYILTQMTQRDYSFQQAVAEAQQNGFAERDPTLDINGMDSAHKLAILTYLAFGKFVNVKDIYTEGITHINQDDIEHAETLGLAIKLLAIAKRINNEIEIRVHPTLISKEHPLASLNGVLNGVFIDTDPLGSILLSGKGAGQMIAASGVISDLINLASRYGTKASQTLINLYQENPEITIRKIDDISSKYYIRFMATDKPGTLAQITGILGNHNIGINSITQKAHNKVVAVPVIMLTESAPERLVRLALEEIYKLGIVKVKPVAIRMENLK